MNRETLAGALAAVLLLATSALADVYELGDQDFVDGQDLLGSVAQFDGASTGEPPPFDLFRGDDRNGSPAFFMESWTFNFAPRSYADGSLTIGIYDNDAQLSGPQVDTFSFDGVDLAADLNAAFESANPAHGIYQVFTLPLTPQALAAAADGAATVSLKLNGGSGQLGNGAGLDFSRLTLLVPEPTALTAACSAIAAAAFTRASGRRPPRRRAPHRVSRDRASGARRLGSAAREP